METALLLPFLLLFAFTTTLPSTIVHATVSTRVRSPAIIINDTDGHAIRSNGDAYYIVPGGRYGSGGGGLKLAKTENDAYPLTIVQDPSEYFNGLSVRVSSQNPNEPISVESQLNIEFEEVKPSKWQIVEKSVKINGGNEISETYPFRIARYRVKNYYRLLYCPDASSSCKSLRIVTDNQNNRRLVVEDSSGQDDLRFMFKKATKNYAEISSVID